MCEEMYFCRTKKNMFLSIRDGIGEALQNLELLKKHVEKWLLRLALRVPSEEQDSTKTAIKKPEEKRLKGKRNFNRQQGNRIGQSMPVLRRSWSSPPRGWATRPSWGAWRAGSVPRSWVLQSREPEKLALRAS